MIADEVLPITLTTEEVRAAARLTGLAPPPAFGTGWADDELGVAEAVAVRSLLARGLAAASGAQDGPDVGLTSAVRSALDPVLAPDTLIEISHDRGPRGRRRTLAGRSAAGRVRAEEGHPSVWHLETQDQPLSIDPFVQVVPDAERPRTLSDRFTVTGRTLARAETMLAQDGAARLPRMLLGCGLDSAAADALAEILSTTHVVVTVRAVRRVDLTTRIADAVTWLDAGRAGLWLVTPAEGDQLGDSEASEYTIEPTQPAAVRDAVARLLEEFSWQSR